MPITFEVCVKEKFIIYLDEFFYKYFEAKKVTRKIEINFFMNKSVYVYINL